QGPSCAFGARRLGNGVGQRVPARLQLARLPIALLLGEPPPRNHEAQKVRVYAIVRVVAEGESVEPLRCQGVPVGQQVGGGPVDLADIVGDDAAEVGAQPEDQQVGQFAAGLLVLVVNRTADQVVQACLVPGDDFVAAI